MYVVTDSAESDCYLSVPPDPGIEPAALGASASAAPGTGESALSGTAPTEALHTFTLDSGASRSFFRDSTTLTPLSRPVAVSLADSSRGPVLAHYSTVLPCPAAPSGVLSGLHLPSFSTNLVRGADLQDAWVDQFTLGGQRVTHCTCSRTGRHLATFTCQRGSSLYTLTTASPSVSASGQVAVTSQVFAAASRSSSASAPCSCRPLSHETLLWHHRLGHPSLPRLRGMASRTLGRQHAAPHSSTFPPTKAPLQTLHMDVWGPARVRGQGHERYFLLVVDDYSRYTTLFPLRRKGEVPEFSSDLLRAFCRAEGIRQTFMLPASPQQNGIAERRIGMVMDVARTSMIHAAAPHFLWSFSIQYAAHQINLQPRVSLPETTPTLSGQAVLPCLSYYHLFPYRTASLPSSPLFLAPGTPPVDPLPPQGPASSGVSQVDPAKPVEVAVNSGSATGAELAGAGTRGEELGGAEPEGVESGGAEPEGVEPGGPEPERVEPGGAERGGCASWGAETTRAESGGSPGVPLRREPLSPQQLREWYAWRCRRAPGAARARGATGAAGGAAAAGAARGAASVGAAGGASRAVGAPAGYGAPGVAGLGATRIGGTGATGAGGAAGVGAAGNGAGGVVAVVAGDPGAEGTGAVSRVSGGVARPRPYYVPLLQHVLGLPPSPGPAPPLLSPPPRCEPESRPMSPESRPVSPESRSASPCVPMPSPPASSLPDSPDPESDSLRAASPTVTRFLATAATEPLFESTAASALVAELSASASVCPLSVEGECALGTDVLEGRQEEFECFAAAVPHLVSMLLAPEGDPDAPDIPTPRSYAEAIEGPYSSQWQAAMDTEMASWKSIGTYVDEVSPAWGEHLYGLRQAPREWHDTLRTTLATLGFAPSTADSSLFLRTDTTLPPFYVLVYVDDLAFATADTEALAHVKSELQKRHTCTDLAPPSDESVEPSGPYPELVGCLMYLMTCTRPDLAYPLSLLARYVAPGRHRKVHWDAAKRVLRYLCSTSGMWLVLGGRARVVLTGHADASWVDDLATQRSSQGYTFSLGSGSVSWRSIRSSSVLSSSCEAEIYTGAMSA
ncbi:unnamed protein product [Closterium sp. NIES-54]